MSKMLLLEIDGFGGRTGRAQKTTKRVWMGYGGETIWEPFGGDQIYFIRCILLTI